MPELIKAESVLVQSNKQPLKRLITTIMIAALLISGALSWFASEQPDGLEWAILQTAGHDELQNSSWLHESLAQWQQRFALFSDYQAGVAVLTDKKSADSFDKPAKSPGDLDTSVAGIIGAVLILAIVGIIGAGCHLLAKRSAN
jgi:cobalt/nickel transport system permease protein